MVTKTNSKIIKSFLIAALLSASTFAALIPSLARAQTTGANWPNPWGDAVNSNSTPQTQITAANLASLGATWIFPFPVITPSALGSFGVGYPSFGTAQGPGTPPIVVNGILYEAINQQDIFAFDAASGKLIWRWTPPVYLQAYQEHSITYYQGKIWEMIRGSGFYAQLIGVDALTGDLKVNISSITLNLPGQRFTPAAPFYGKNYSNLIGTFYNPEWAPVFYKNLALVQAATFDYISRGFLSAYDINTGKLVWRWYVNPPAPNCDPNWDFENLVDLGNGTTVNYGQVPGNVSPYKGDWGTDCSLNGAAGLWDNPAVDNQTGIVYFQTSGPYPTQGGKYRPGPDLWSDSIIAMNATNGKMLWFYQTTTHDTTGEQDCQWSAALINVQGRKEIAVPCRMYFYGLDATTGKLLWSYDPIKVQATFTTPIKDPERGANMGDEMNMTYAYGGAPRTTGLWGPFNSSVNENAPAFDGRKTVFYWGNRNGLGTGGGACAKLPPLSDVRAPPLFQGVGQSCAGVPGYDKSKFPQSSTLVALDATTGQITWHQTFPLLAYRGGLTYINGAVIGCTSDGHCRGFDGASGNILWDKFMGVAMSYVPTFGATADGKILAFLPVGGGLIFGAVPGYLAAFSVAPPSSTATATATTTAVSISTVIGPSTGIDPTTFYVVAAFAVIFVIATGFLALRRRRPTT